MKIICNILLVIYFLFLLIATTLLFTINEFSDSKIGDTFIIGVDRKTGDFRKGDLLVVKGQQKINKNDEIIYYDTDSQNNFTNVAKVFRIIKTNSKETTFVIGNNVFISSQYVIGKTSEVKKISFIGYIFNLITNRIIYLFLFILPTTIYFIYSLRKYKMLKNE